MAAVVKTNPILPNNILNAKCLLIVEKQGEEDSNTEGIEIVEMIGGEAIHRERILYAKCDFFLW